jgi:hypothetical protein
MRCAFAALALVLACNGRAPAPQRTAPTPEARTAAQPVRGEHARAVDSARAGCPEPALWKSRLVQPDEIAALRATPGSQELRPSSELNPELWRLHSFDQLSEDDTASMPGAIEHRRDPEAEFERGAISPEPIGNAALIAGPSGAILVGSIKGLFRYFPESRRWQRFSRSAGAHVYVLDARTFIRVGPYSTELWDLPSARRLGRADHGLTRPTSVRAIDDSRVLIEAAPSEGYRMPARLWSRDCGLPAPTWEDPYLLDRGSPPLSTVMSDGALLTLSGFWRTADGRHTEWFDPPLSVLADSNSPEGSSLVALSEREALLVGGVVIPPDGSSGEEWIQERILPVRRLELPPLEEHPAPQLKYPRFGHTATTLPGGSALIAGGAWFSGATKVAERWDPQAQRFRPAGRLRQPRVGHTATLLQDGSVLLVGGCAVEIEANEDNDLPGVRVSAKGTAASAELWRRDRAQTSDAGRLQTPRCGHSAVRLADGRVLVIGGYERADPINVEGTSAGGDGQLTSTEIFDPRTGRWSRGADLRHGRVQAATALLPDGRLLVAGDAPRDNVPAPVEALSADGSSWQTLGPLPLRTGEGLTVVPTGDGRLLVAYYGEVLEVPLP